MTFQKLTPILAILFAACIEAPPATSPPDVRDTGIPTDLGNDSGADLATDLHVEDATPDSSSPDQSVEMDAELDIPADIDIGTPECTDTAMCDDGISCNGVETCVEGKCQPGTPAACSPPIVPVPCQDLVCDPAAGLDCALAPLPNNTMCDDGDACTMNDMCRGGECSGSAQLCTGGRVCVGGSCTCPQGSFICDGACTNQCCSSHPTSNCTRGQTDATNCPTGTFKRCQADVNNPQRCAWSGCY